MLHLANVFQELWNRMPSETQERILRVWADIDESAEDKFPETLCSNSPRKQDGGGIFSE
jgi:hypothetical protein